MNDGDGVSKPSRLVLGGPWNGGLTPEEIVICQAGSNAPVCVFEEMNNV